MSRIYFHSKLGTEEVLGSERAWIGALSDDVGMASLDVGALSGMDEWLTLDIYGKRFREAVAAEMGSRAVEGALLAFRYEDRAGRAPLSYRGTSLAVWDLTLNTAMRLGSPAVQLATRLHAQCEIHAWVDGPNRAWLADIIEAGMAAGVFRRGGARDPGWGGIVELLRSDDEGPVVTSYSVTDQFPNESVSDWMPPWPEGVERDWRALTEQQQAERSARSEAWYELDWAEQWRMGVDWLRRDTGGLELKPEGFADFTFGNQNGLTWLDLMAGERRLRQVLELEEVQTPA